MLQKKILKILSVLVAMIIAFSCFILSCSAVSVSGISSLGNISLSSVEVHLDWYDESNKRHYAIATDMTAEGFNGDGSLRLHCALGSFSGSTNHTHYTVPAGAKVFLRVYWTGSEDDIYFSFPSIFTPHPSYSSIVNGSLKCTCSTRSTYSDGVFHALSGSNCKLYHSRHSIECYFIPDISFSQFDFNISLTDPTIVPPMVAFFNELGQFFGFSINTLSDSFNNVVIQTPLLILLLSFSIVSFGFVLLYRFIKE